MLSNLTGLLGLLLLVAAAALVTPAAGFGVAGASCLWVSWVSSSRSGRDEVQR